MPPIQVYTKSPINPAKASGITPQTTHPGANAPADIDAHASPAPPNRPAPNPTPTPGQRPPPPQPGAVPRLPEATGTPSSPLSLPPPPRAGAGPAPPALTPAPVLAAQIPGPSYPPQMAIPLTQQPAGFHQRGTATATGTGTAPSTGTGPVTGLWSAGPRGYQQNTSGPAPAPEYVPPYQGGNRPGYYGGVHEDEEEGLFNSAVKLAKAAGKKLSAAESEVWKRINGEGR